MNAISMEACPQAQVKLSGRALLLLSLIVFFFFLALLLTVVRDDGLLRDPDTFWHIEVGRRILLTGAFPRVDEFSHTFQGQPWIAKEWLSQIIFALSYRVGGWTAVVTISVSAIALTFALLFAELARQMRPTVALSILFYCYALTAPHFLARPHLLSFPLVVLWFVGLVRAVERRTCPNLLLLPLMTLWANLHAGFTFGLGAGGLLALEAIWECDPKYRLKTALTWAMFIGAAAMAGLITPYGYHSIFVTAQVFGGNEALDYINEWQPINFAKETFVALLIIGPIFLALLLGVRIKFVRLVIATVLFYLMLVHFRLISLFALVSPILIASSLLAQFPSLSFDQSSSLMRLMRSSRPYYAMVVLVFIAGLSLFALHGRGIGPSENISPAKAVNYLLRTDPAGRVFNAYDFGGYLIFRGVKTFIDGRSDQLFGDGFLSRIFESVKKPDKEFLQLLDEYNISSVLVRPISDEALKLDRASIWRRGYADDVSAVYQRVTP